MQGFVLVYIEKREKSGLFFRSFAPLLHALPSRWLFRDRAMALGGEEEARRCWCGSSWLLVKRQPRVDRLLRGRLVTTYTEMTTGLSYCHLLPPPLPLPILCYLFIYLFICLFIYSFTCLFILISEKKSK